jgi:gas vesicle protein
MKVDCFRVMVCTAMVIALPALVLAEDDSVTVRKASLTLSVSSDKDVVKEVSEAVEDVHGRIEDIKEECQDKIDDVKEELSDVADDLREELEECKHERGEETQETRCHRGGNGIISTQFLWLDTDPIHELCAREKTLKGKDFNFDENRVAPMIGIIGLRNQGNGIRIGQGIWCGYKRFQSELYAATKIDTVTNDTQTVDSVILLRAIPAQLGFIVEKSFGFGNWELFAGAMLGGGAEVLISQFKEADGTIFISDDDNNDHDFDSDTLDHHTSHSIGATVATFLAWDVHAGASVSLAPGFHLGLDGVVNFNYSPEGFGRLSGDFLAVNPGLRLRLTFGKMG